MLSNIALFLSCLLSLTSAITITSPAAGAQIDRSKSFNIVWTVADDDPYRNSEINISVSYAGTTGVSDTIATNLTVPVLKHVVPAYSLNVIGEASIIMNTVGSQGNAFLAQVHPVYIEAGSGAQNASMTVSPTAPPTMTSGAASQTTTSSAGAASGNNGSGMMSACIAWLTALGMLL